MERRQEHRSEQRAVDRRPTIIERRLSPIEAKNAALRNQKETARRAKRNQMAKLSRRINRGK